MVAIVKRRKGGRFFYYLKHTSTSRQRETYLGRSIPENIRELKEKFMLEFYRQEWQSDLEAISKGYKAELKRTPRNVREDLLANFCTDFTYHTQRIEGSAMTFRETANLLLHGVQPFARPENERREAEAHKRILVHILNGEHNITMKTVLAWHEEIFSLTDRADAGAVRRYAAGVRGGKTEFPLWYDLPDELDRFFAWYNASKSTLNPAELAALAHYRFVSIHPFGDGNGRISRLIMNCILHDKDYPMFIVRTGDRASYVRSLERSTLGGNAAFFVYWFMKRYVKSNSQYINEP